MPKRPDPPSAMEHTVVTDPVTIELSPEIYRELEHLVAMHKRCGAANPMATVDQLVSYILAAIADGSRRPGAWERQMLDMMGLVADCPEHDVYRAGYGPADDTEGR